MNTTAASRTVAQVLTAAGFTVTGPQPHGTCYDCGAHDVEVAYLPDFDTYSGDALPDFPVCAYCLPMRV